MAFPGLRTVEINPGFAMRSMEPKGSHSPVNDGCVDTMVFSIFIGLEYIDPVTMRIISDDTSSPPASLSFGSPTRGAMEWSRGCVQYAACMG